MGNSIQLLDSVALVQDLPEHGLSVGEVGTVVELLSSTAFEVEFADRNGRTYGLFTLKAQQIVPLHNRGVAFRTLSEAV